jgi:glycosyltransferase involved in cell wall biosynthesis
MPEVGGEKGAVYVDPYSVSSIREGIMNIITDKALRNNLIENGYLNIKRFDPSTISKMYVNLYQQI